MPKYERDAARLIHTETGKEIMPGDTVVSFRGEETVFRYVSRLPEFGKEGKIFTDIRPGGEFYPSVMGARIELASRFCGYKTSAIDGTLHIESLPDAEVLTLARDALHTSPVFGAVDKWMRSRSGEDVNPSWITMVAATTAYDRELITGEDLDRLTA